MGKHSELNMNRRFNGTREAKHATRAPHAKEYLMERPVPIFDEDTVVEYVDPNFDAYSEKVQAVIENAKGPITYGEIHRQLGDEARRDLTPAVCNGLVADTDIVHIPGYLDRFCVRAFLPKRNGKVIDPSWPGEMLMTRARCFKGSRWM